MTALVSASWLQAHLADTDLRIVDCRWYLEDAGRGRREYQTEHIPGAIFLDLETELSDPDRPGRGRHPLPDPGRFAAMLGSRGIGDQHLVAAYDSAGGAVAARLWWMLRSLGHRRVRVLDGGWTAWIDSGGTTTDQVPVYPPARFSGEPVFRGTIDRDEVLVSLGRISLVDARAPERYRGEVEPVDPVAGHIPSAHSRPYAGNLDDRGRFLPPERLAERFAGLDDRPLVSYCGSGVTACHNILAAHLAGLPEPRLYAGSWSEWAGAGLPAAVGAEPGSPPA